MLGQGPGEARRGLAVVGLLGGAVEKPRQGGAQDGLYIFLGRAAGVWALMLSLLSMAPIRVFKSMVGTSKRFFFIIKARSRKVNSS